MSTAVFPTLTGSLIDVERTPIYSTSVQTEASGRELRVAQRSAARYRWRIRYDHLRQDASPDDAQTLLAFFAARRGSLDSFLYLDPYASTATQTSIGTGDGVTTTFYLRDEMGDRIGYWKDSGAGSPFLYINGVLKARPADYAWTVAEGKVVFTTPPSVGADVSWTGSFYRMVRFASDELQTQRRFSRIWRAEVELISTL